jgi:hypothetical protein
MNSLGVRHALMVVLNRLSRRFQAIPSVAALLVPREFLCKAEVEAKSLSPSGYGDTRTTTLMAEVKEQSNTINFDLSDTDAPPAPTKIPAKASGHKRQ